MSCVPLGTWTVDHVRPPSVDRPTRPRVPGACTRFESVARTRDRVVSSPEPSRVLTGTIVGVGVEVPTSGSRTVAPNEPTPTAPVGDANVAAKIGCGAGSTAVTVAPPSVVRSSLSPASLAITHVFGFAQRTLVSLPAWAGPGTGTGFQVSPPSVDFRIVLLSPTA